MATTISSASPVSIWLHWSPSIPKLKLPSLPVGKLPNEVLGTFLLAAAWVALMGPLASFLEPLEEPAPILASTCIRAIYDVDQAYRESTLAQCRAQGTPINDF